MGRTARSYGTGLLGQDEVWGHGSSLEEVRGGVYGIGKLGGINTVVGLLESSSDFSIFS